MSASLFECSFSLMTQRIMSLPPNRKFHILSGGLRSGVVLEYGFLCEFGLVFLLVLLFLYFAGEVPLSR